MGTTFYFAWEPELMETLQSHMGTIGTTLAKFFTNFGEELLLVAVLGFIYWCWDKKYGLFVGLELLCACLWNPMIKNIFLRRRPYCDHAGIKCLKPVDASADIYDLSVQGYSFPSGHSANAAATYGAIAAYKKNRLLTVLAVVLSLLVGVSRVMLGVHYPTDVLAGWALGLLIVIVISLVQKKVKRRWLLYLILLMTALPGFFYCKSTDFYSSYGMMLGMALGEAFEKHFVNFENTRNPFFMILRLLIGCALFFGLNTVLKMPFSKEFLNAPTIASFLVRTARYAFVIFFLLGIYPLAFRVEKKKEKAVA